MKLFYKGLVVFSAAAAAFFGGTSVSAEESLDEFVPVETETISTEEAEPVHTGWFNDGDNTYYYTENNAMSVGLTEIEGKTYYFAPNGVMKTGWYTIDDVRMFFDYETGCRKDGWIDYLGCRFYSDPQYGKLVGMQEIDGKKYIFDENGSMCSGWTEYENSKYYSESNGELVTGNYEINGIIYHFSPEGRYQSGWQTTDGLRIFYDYETETPIYGWISYNGFIYYADEVSGKYTGDKHISDDVYRFSEKGYMLTGFQKFSDGIRFYYDDGSIAEGFLKNDGNVYYFGTDHLMKTGWQNIDKSKYFFYDSGKMATGFCNVDGKKYYFDKNGKMQTGWKKVGIKKYYFGKDGVMNTGFCKIDSNTYYFGKDGAMRTGWQSINSKKYHFKDNGAMSVGFCKIEGNTYYFGSDGAMKKGFCKIGSDTYYFDKNGVMKTGWQNIEGKKYFFDSSGVLKPFVPKVFVGVGHGGVDSGAVKYIVEKEYTLKTGKLVEQYLHEAGIECILSRDADIDTTMEGKLEMCNDYDPDLIIDIHFNAGGGHGFEVYHSQYGGMSLTLAENINSEIQKIMDSSGCKIMLWPNGQDRFTIIRETHAPAVLLEGGFVDDWADAEFIKKNYKKIARAYADGVLKTIDLMMKKRT